MTDASRRGSTLAHAPEPARGPAAEPSLADLVSGLVADSGKLFKLELRLARSEILANLQAAGGGAAMIGIAAVLALGGVGTLLAAAVGALAPLVGAGWAGLIVSIATFAVAGVLVVVGGRRLRPAALRPDRTIESVGDSVDAIKGK